MKIACRSIERGEEAKTEIEKITPEKKGGLLTVMQLDLSDIKSVKNFAKEYKEKRKKIDILMNNAGVMCLDKGGKIKNKIK